MDVENDVEETVVEVTEEGEIIQEEEIEIVSDSESEDAFSVEKKPVKVDKMKPPKKRGTNTKKEKNKPKKKKLGKGYRIANLDVDESKVSGAPEEGWFVNECFPIRWLLMWFTSILFKGLMEPPTMQDLPRVLRHCMCENVEKRFDFIWPKLKGMPFRFLLAINYCFGIEFWVSGLIMVMASVSQIFVPRIMEKFLKLLYLPTVEDVQEYDGYLERLQDILPSNHEIYPPNTSEFARDNDWEIWVWLAVFAMCYVIQIWAMNYSMHISTRVGMKVRTLLVTKVYQKSFLLSNKAKGKYENGVIVNHCSLDATKIERIHLLLHYGWCSWIMLFGSIGFLIDLIDWGAMTGLLTNFLVVPIAFTVIIFFLVLFILKARTVDKRVNKTNESLQSIRIIKFFSWEHSFLKKIVGLRKKEVYVLRVVFSLFSFLIAVFTSLSNIVCLVAFVTFFFVHDYLDSIKVFTSMTYFRMLRMPLVFAPMIIVMLIEMCISMGRITKLLEAEEIEELPRGKNEEYPIIIEGGEFQWEISKAQNLSAGKTAKEMKKEKMRKMMTGICGKCIPKKKPKTDDLSIEDSNNNNNNNEEDNTLGNLMDIDLRVRKGSLVMVIGRVGSGKSSLLYSILGEMKKTMGDLLISGRFSYTSQLSWVQNASLYENVVFGEEEDDEKWSEIVDCCQLQQDLDELKGGKDIEIGEKGINLSGGQKYRVQLARACYIPSDIVLLDDPLAAVDAHVGKRIFHKCIVGYLKERTRVLVTHQLNYIKHADWIVLMDEGRILEQGTYQELMEKKEDGHVFQLHQEYVEKENENNEKKKGIIISSSEDSDDDDDDEKKIEIVEEFLDEEFLSEEELSIRRAKTEAKKNSKRRQKERKKRIMKNLEKRRSDKKKNKNKRGEEVNRIMSDEEMSRGMISLRVICKYIVAMGCCGIVPLVIIFFCYFFTQLVQSSTDYFLTEWSAGTWNEKFGNQYDLYYFASHVVERPVGCDGEVEYDMTYSYMEFDDWPPGSFPILSNNSMTPPVVNGTYMNCSKYGKGLVIIPTTYSCPSVISWCGCYVKEVDVVWDRGYNNDELVEDGMEQIHSVIIYGVLSLFYVVCSFVRTITFTNFAVSAAQVLHNRAIERVLKAPVWFFDTTPIGRIINRFSHDITCVDSQLINSLTTAAGISFNCFGMLFMIIYYTDGFGAIFVLPLMLFYFVFWFLYRKTTLELKRLENVSKSPILSHISESLNGMPTIRAYEVKQRFVDRLRSRIDLNNRAFYLMMTAQRWLGMYLGVVGVIFICCICSFLVVVYYYWDDFEMDIAYSSIAFSYSILATQVFFKIVEQLSEAEVMFNSVERLEFYSKNIPNEVENDITKEKPKDFMKKGNIKFTDYSMRYRKELDLVLKDLNFEIKPFERIGIVGRTGSGKSSLMIALWRIVEPASGKIEIDGYDIEKDLNLHQLRASLSIIPQDATLFSGTVRSNLDPFNQYKDEEIWSALENTYMKKKILRMTGHLSTEMKEGGSNFSVGERQLLCLARALLRNSKILVLDEATASVDVGTDAKIQRTIRESFKNCTSLTIAHRLETIIDSDRILVMDDGRVAEFDTPKNLLEDVEKYHLLRDLVHETGEATEALLYDYAYKRKELEILSVDVVEEEVVVVEE